MNDLSEHSSDPITPHRIDARGVFTPRGGTDPWAHRRGEPRTFIALWLFALFGIVGLTFGATGFLGLIASEVYRGAARTMLVLLAVGLCVLWPMLRLSQERPEKPPQAIASDLFFLLPPVFALLAPQSLRWMAAWPVEVCLCLAATLAAWALVTGGILAGALTQPAHSRLTRTRPILAIIALVCAGPLFMLVSTGAHGTTLRTAEQSDASRINHLAMASPFTAVFEIARDRSWSGTTALVTREHWLWVLATMGLALCAWAWALASTRGPRAASVPIIPQQPR